MRKAGDESGPARRGFLAGALAGLAAARPLFAIAGETTRGANDRPGVGFIGTGGRCQAHIAIVNAPKARVHAPLSMAILSYRENKVARFDPQREEMVL